MTPLRFAIIAAPFAAVAPRVQQALDCARGKAMGGVLDLNERWTLRREGLVGAYIPSHLQCQVLEIGEQACALIPDSEFWVSFAVSLLLPDADVAEFEIGGQGNSKSWAELSVWRAGRPHRHVRNERDGDDWSWQAGGAPAEWEDVEAYLEADPADRLNRDRVFAYARALGFDAAGHFDRTDAAGDLPLAPRTGLG